MPHHIPVREVARANLAIALTLVWSGVAACVVAACVSLGQVRGLLDIFIGVASFESCVLRPTWASYS
jgi:hypothetical protein